MGNKLCAPLLKKSYRGTEANPWSAKRDSHLLRLWADVFRVHGDGEYMRWERVSDDVVPVNIACVEDTPNTIFLITAYNRQVEKIFDVTISQPGTIICPATECFVHWRDIPSQCEWGLNFSTPTDAQRFRDCCSYPTQRFARKASSASSLRLSPPKRQRSKAASASSPNSPVRHSNPVTSEAPGEDGCEHAQGLTVISTHRHQGRQGSSPTRSRTQNGGTNNNANSSSTSTTSNPSPPPDYAVIQRKKNGSEDNPKHSSSSASSSLRKSDVLSGNSSRVSDSSSSGGGGGGGGGENGGGGGGGGWGRDARGNCKSGAATPTPISSATPLTSSPSRKTKSNSLPSKITPQAVANANATMLSTMTSSSFCHMTGPASTTSSSHTSSTLPPPQTTSTATASTTHRASSLKHSIMDPSIQPSSAISDLANQKGPNSSNSPKHVVISDIVSVNITGTSTSNSPMLNPNSEKPPNGILKRDSSLNRSEKQRTITPDMTVTVRESSPFRKKGPVRSLSYSPPPPPPEENTPTSPQNSSSLSLPSSSQPKSTLRVDTGATGASRHTSSSESPEWPSPPEPLTPQTPQTPNTPNTTGHMSFDSETIQRMLRSLPLERDFAKNESSDLGFHEDSNPTSTTDETVKMAEASSSSRAASRLSRTKSLNVHDRSSKPTIHSTKQHSMDVGGGPSGGRGDHARANHPGHAKPRMFNKIALEKELKKRNKNIAASYPDSGIGLTGDKGSSSVRSDASLKSAFSKMGHDHKASTTTGGASSGSRTTSDHSEIIRNLGEGSDVRQYLAPDLLSDDENDDNNDDNDSNDSLDTMTETESQVAYARQVGAIRKAGWLVVKNWLLHKKKKIELAPRRAWKRYWVCLKGTTLLFFDCDEETSVTENSIPRHILVIEGGIAQAVPEHPKRDNIFSLSSACGGAYLFQASSQIDLENWIRAIHSACASSYARQHGKDNTLKLLCSELLKLESSIDMDVKMRKMAELQMTVVTDPRSRMAIVKQIAQWEENLEKLYIDQYRFRCYSASLQGSELPNPKNLLACASKASKTTLGRLGIFTVTSFHALISARKPLVLPNIYGKTSQKGGMLSPKTENTTTTTQQKPRSRTPTALVSSSISSDALVKANKLHSDSMDNLLDKSGGDSSSGQESLSKVSLPNNQCYNFQTMLIGVDRGTSVQDILETTCNKRQLNPRDHYVRIKPLGSTDNTFVIPDRHENIKKLRYDAIEVCQKCIFQMELTKPTKDGMFGFAIEAELAEDLDRDDELRVYVCDVTKDGVADKRGLILGDEILVINSKIISELDMVYIETLLHESRTLFLTVRSIRTQPPSSNFLTMHADAYINNMVVPPPPSQSRISDKSLGSLIVPAPSPDDDPAHPANAKDKSFSNTSPAQIDALLEGAEQVTAICRRNEMSPGMDENVTGKPMSDPQRLRKAVMELVETERAYVKDLKCLTERYLEPLKEETFLTSGEIQQLFGNIQEIVAFQQRFLHSLEEAVELVPEFFTTSNMASFKRVLFSLGGSFLYYANHFKVYSSFCASHSRSQKILNPDANEALRDFLHARNPKQQHSATLESYLIKPIQRILKYPLLLQQLCNMTPYDTDEHHHLSEALKGMEAVAEHINEMQKIYDEYGCVFDELTKAHRDNYPHKQGIELSVGDLQMYGTVEWVNVVDHLGKVKKSAEFENVVFVFKSGVTFLCRERLKRKKSKTLTARSSLIEVSETVERFRTLIPTQEVQIRTGKIADMDRHYWWDLVHSRSEVEGRAEKVYQFCNSTCEAKSDFMKVIRQTIRESVRKMIIPPSASSSSSSNQQQQHHPHHPHHHPHHHHSLSHSRQQSANSSSPSSLPPPYDSLNADGSGGGDDDDDGSGAISGSGASPLPSSSQPPSSSTATSTTSQAMSSPHISGLKRRGKVPDSERHSMDVDKKVGDMDLDSAFRIRSKTVSDLNEASMEESGGFVPDTLEPTNSDKNNKESSSCSSNSNLSCSSHSGSQTGSQSSAARLQYASSNPLHYSSSSINSGERQVGSSSPVWKRANKIATNNSQTDDTYSTRSGEVSSTSGESIAPPRRDTKTVVFAPIPGLSVFKDTEC